MREKVWPKYLVTRELERAAKELDLVRAAAGTAEKDGKPATGEDRLAQVERLLKEASEKRKFTYALGRTGPFIGSARSGRPAAPPTDATADQRLAALRRAYVRKYGYDEVRSLGSIQGVRSIEVGALGRRILRDQDSGEDGTQAAYLVQVAWRANPSPEEFNGKQYLEWLGKAAVRHGRGVGPLRLRRAPPPGLHERDARALLRGLGRAQARLRHRVALRRRGHPARGAALVASPACAHPRGHPRRPSAVRDPATRRDAVADSARRRPHGEGRGGARVRPVGATPVAAALSIRDGIVAGGRERAAAEETSEGESRAANGPVAPDGLGGELGAGRREAARDGEERATGTACSRRGARGGPGSCGVARDAGGRAQVAQEPLEGRLLRGRGAATPAGRAGPATGRGGGTPCARGDGIGCVGPHSRTCTGVASPRRGRPTSFRTTRIRHSVPVCLSAPRADGPEVAVQAQARPLRVGRRSVRGVRRGGHRRTLLPRATGGAPRNVGSRSVQRRRPSADGADRRLRVAPRPVGDRLQVMRAWRGPCSALGCALVALGCAVRPKTEPVDAQALALAASASVPGGATGDLVRELASDDFVARSRAAEALVAQGERALPALGAAGERPVAAHGRVAVSTTRPVVAAILSTVPEERLVRVHLPVRRGPGPAGRRRRARSTRGLGRRARPDRTTRRRGRRRAGRRRSGRCAASRTGSTTSTPRRRASTRVAAVERGREWWNREGRLAAPESARRSE